VELVGTGGGGGLGGFGEAVVATSFLLFLIKNPTCNPS